ncbi:MAG: Uma2 family endonuclease [Caldilineaceae bacterium]
MIVTPTQPTTTTPVADQQPVNGALKKTIIYPESDGKPMADNTKQFNYIVSIKTGYDGLYKDDPNVFVAGDLLWYPVEGDNRTRNAPDVMLVFGRPKGHRGSYRQWQEGNLAPQVVFEILSPGNRLTEMAKKRLFYEHFGVEEYYEYDPDRGDLAGWIRQQDRLEPIEEMQGWVSPRTDVRFALDEQGELLLYRPDGRRFETYVELLERAEQEAARAEQERTRAEQAQLQAEQERMRAEQEAARAEQERVRAEQAQLLAEQERLRAERMAARLRELGIDPT